MIDHITVRDFGRGIAPEHQARQFEPQLIEIRRRGYAETVDELEEGFAAVATPLRGPHGDVQGALSIGGPTQRLGHLRFGLIGIVNPLQRLRLISSPS